MEAKDLPVITLVEQYDLYNTLAIIHQIENQNYFISQTLPFSAMEQVNLATEQIA